MILWSNMHWWTVCILSQWLYFHVCFAFQASSARITLVSNGKVISDKKDEKIETNNTKVSLSLDVYLLYSTFGEATDLQVWDHWKSPEELLRWVDCQDEGEEGNLVAWTSTQWDLVGLVEKQVGETEFLILTYLSFTKMFRPKKSQSVCLWIQVSKF